MTNEVTKKQAITAKESEARRAQPVRSRAHQAPVSAKSRDRRVTGYTRVKSGDIKRRSVTRTPDMSNPNAKAINPQVALG